MAVAIELVFRGATLDQYDKVTEGMGLRPGGPAPPRALFHWVTKTDDGIRVVDVWETMEDFQRFAEEQIGPQSAAAGITEKPEMTTHEVHNYFTTG
ncbi:MAG: hypothetical protein QOJ43_2764 [Gaiellaceae bacterium]|jgi:hypothetical protein|nr:hypothetical protein [Gaiellaceae bacterium]